MDRSPPLALAALLVSAPLWATTYYVSSVTGSDGNSGQSPGAPFASVARVNQVALQPGDEVRFFCGEAWRADPLSVEESGTAAQPILFSSYPAGCADRPLLSGARPISGWSLHAGSVWVADLDLGANAGLFPHGVNQLFRGNVRLPFGRWPDLEGHPDGGWASLDAQPAANQVADADLPAADWTGAVAHIRGMTWYILNREVTADAGSTLTLGHDAACWNGNCAGWGYYLSSHLATLSREGEWFWDQASNRVYLHTSSGPPAAAEVEGSAVLVDDERYHGGVVLGRDLYQHVSHVRLENLRLERWYGSGVTTPTNLESAENDHVTLSGVEIRDVDDAGIRLTTWVWNPAVGPAGWRGGSDHLVEDVVVERAGHFGVDSYARLSTFRRVTIRDVGRIPYAGRSGIGCGFGPNDWDCTEAGAGVRLKRDQPVYSSTSLLLTGLRLERIGMNGVDLFGDTIAIDDTVIRSACLSKSDCGGIRTFGDAPLSGSPVHDVLITDTLISDVQASTAGCHPSYRYPLGFGVYVDHYSRDVDLERVTASACRPTGILYQDSTGDVASSVAYGPTPGTWGGSALVVAGSGQATLHDSTLFSLDTRREPGRHRHPGHAARLGRQLPLQPVGPDHPLPRRDLPRPGGLAERDRPRPHLDRQLVRPGAGGAPTLRAVRQRDREPGRGRPRRRLVDRPRAEPGRRPGPAPVRLGGPGPPPRRPFRRRLRERRHVPLELHPAVGRGSLLIHSRSVRRRKNGRLRPCPGAALARSSDRAGHRRPGAP